nr:EOG090X089S [Sida crystallina]
MMATSFRPAVMLRALIQTPKAGLGTSRFPQQIVTASLISNLDRKIHSLSNVSTPGLLSGVGTRPPFFTQQRFAARKGTREKKSKKIVKKEVQKEEFLPYMSRSANKNVSTGPRRLIESGRQEAVDDVYGFRYFMTRPISFAEAIQFHRETNHPTVYNRPDSFAIARVELDMSMEKKNRYIDNFTRIVLLPHDINLNLPKKVVAFCKTPETQEAAKAAGAELVGGVDLVKSIQSGSLSLSEYDHIVAHTHMLNDLAPVRGLMKKKFPNLKNGSMGTEMSEMIERFSKGVEFASTKDSQELDFGLVEVPIGKLTMSMEELEANFKAILKDIDSCRGRVSSPFIVHCYILCPPSKEKFLITHQSYLDVSKSGKSSKWSAKAAQEVNDEEDDADEDKDEQLEDNDDQPRKKKASA